MGLKEKLETINAATYLDPSTMPSAGPIGSPIYRKTGTLEGIKEQLPAGVSLSMLAAIIIRNEINDSGELNTAAELFELLGKASSDLLGASLLANGEEDKPPAQNDDTELQKRIKAKLKGRK